MESNSGIGAMARVLGFFALMAFVTWTLSNALRKELSTDASYLRFHAIFGSVAGLKTGSPVRLAGVDVGRVADINFVRREGHDAISVAILVREPYAPLVRRGASVGIDSLGVLGDKYVEIGLTEPGVPALSQGETVIATDPISLRGTMQKLDEAVDDLRVVGGFWRRVVEKTEGLKGMWDSFKKSMMNE